MGKDTTPLKLTRVFIFSQGTFRFLTTFEAQEDPLPYVKQVVKYRNKSALIQYGNQYERWVYTDSEPNKKREQQIERKEKKKSRKRERKRIRKYRYPRNR